MSKKPINEWSDGEIVERLKELVKTKPFREATSLFEELNKRGIILHLNAPTIQMRRS